MSGQSLRMQTRAQRLRKIVSFDHFVETTGRLTNSEQIEPWCTRVIHNLRPFNHTNQENTPHKPPYIIRNLSAQVPPEIFADAFRTRALGFTQCGLFVLVFWLGLKHTETLFFVDVGGSDAHRDWVHGDIHEDDAQKSVRYHRSEDLDEP